jgi:hypothetical protein
MPGDVQRIDPNEPHPWVEGDPRSALLDLILRQGSGEEAAVLYFGEENIGLCRPSADAHPIESTDSAEALSSEGTRPEDSISDTASVADSEPALNSDVAADRLDSDQKDSEPPQLAEVDSTDPSLESDAAEADGHTSRRIRADVWTKQGEISVNNYDRNTPTKFTDRGTVLALRALGIQPDELFMPSHKEVAQFGGDPDVRGLFLAHNSPRFDKLRKLVRRERAKILDHEANSGEPSGGAASDKPSVSISGAVEMERRQVERLKVRQKREVEALIDSLLQLDRLRKSMEEA